jgi:hypothetical protein
MTFLTQVLKEIAALLVSIGCPPRQSTLLALILVYLLVSAFIAGLLFLMILRRRRR